MFPLAGLDRCPDCQIGSLHVSRAFFCEWTDGHFITVPDFPARICDVCGRREYDPKSLANLQALLDLTPLTSTPSDGGVAHVGEDPRLPSESHHRHQT